MKFENSNTLVRVQWPGSYQLNKFNFFSTFREADFKVEINIEFFVDLSVPSPH